VNLELIDGSVPAHQKQDAGWWLARTPGSPTAGRSSPTWRRPS